MDPSSGVRHPGQRWNRNRGGRQGPPPPQNPHLFDDTSTQPQATNYDMSDPSAYGYGNYGQMPQNTFQAGNQGMSMGSMQPGFSQPPQFLQDPMANMAMQYGQNLAGQGKEYLNKNIEQYVATSKLKYYFAVDTAYVGRKLGLLLFPFAHKDWSIRYNQEEPVAPRYEVNAPDLYIPVMAFVTYILLAGVVLGTQNSFSPEQLGITASTALVWIVIEIIILLFSMYVMQVSTELKYLDLLAYCGYKYVGMILILLGGLLFHSLGYYLVLLWMSISIAFFLVRSLKFAVNPHPDQDGYSKGSKRRLYILLVIALSQPVFMWWLTRHLIAQ